MIEGHLLFVNFGIEDQRAWLMVNHRQINVYMKTFWSMHKKGYLEVAKNRHPKVMFYASKKLQAEISSKNPIDFQL